VIAITDKILKRGYAYLDYNTNNIMYDGRTVSLIDFDPEMITNIKAIQDQDDREFENGMMHDEREEFRRKLLGISSHLYPSSSIIDGKSSLRINFLI
jgi:hypothetical protein